MSIQTFFLDFFEVSTVIKYCLIERSLFKKRFIKFYESLIFENRNVYGQPEIGQSVRNAIWNIFTLFQQWS